MLSQGEGNCYEELNEGYTTQWTCLHKEIDMMRRNKKKEKAILLTLTCKVHTYKVMAMGSKKKKK
jgi:hypothetical protein